MRTDRPLFPQAKLVTRRLEGKGFDHRLGFLDAMRGIIHSRIVVGEVADSDFAPLILERESRRSRRLVAVFAVASLSLADRGDELDELVALEGCRRCRRALTLEILE